MLALGMICILKNFTDVFPWLEVMWARLAPKWLRQGQGHSLPAYVWELLIDHAARVTCQKHLSNIVVQEAPSGYAEENSCQGYATAIQLGFGSFPTMDSP